MATSNKQNETTVNINVDPTPNTTPVVEAPNPVSDMSTEELLQQVEQPQEAVQVEQPQEAIQEATQIEQPQEAVQVEQTQPTPEERVDQVLEDSFGKRQEIALDQSEKLRKAAIVEAANMSEAQTQLADLERQNQEEADRRQKLFNNTNESINQLNEKIQKFKFTSPSLFSNMSTGNQILATIGIALGSFGRGENTAFKILKDAMDRDLDIQKQQYNSLQDQRSNLRGDIASLTQQFGSLDNAMDAKRIAILNKAKLQAQNMAQKRAGISEVAQLEDLAAKLELEEEVTRQRLMDNVFKNQQERLKLEKLEAAKKGNVDLGIQDLDPKVQDKALKISDKFDAETKTLGTANIVNSFNTIKSSVENPTPAGDLAAVFSFMKILDPNSVVREGEFAKAANAGGVPERVRAQYNKLVGGGELSEKQRLDFFNRSKLMLKNKLKVQARINKKFLTRAKSVGIPEKTAASFLGINQFNNIQTSTQSTVNKNESRKQLEKVLGTKFKNDEELQKAVELLKQAKERKMNLNKL